MPQAQNGHPAAARPDDLLHQLELPNDAELVLHRIAQSRRGRLDHEERVLVIGVGLLAHGKAPHVQLLAADQGLQAMVASLRALATRSAADTSPSCAWT